MASPAAHWNVNGSTRAERFPLHVTLRFRPPGEEKWLEGETENISRSGVLFRTSKLLGVNTPVEIQFSLPVEAGGEPGAAVYCLGRIVRAVVPPPASGESPLIAAKFLEYRIVRGTDGSGR